MATVTIEIPDEFLHQFQQLGDRFPEWLALNLLPSPNPNLLPKPLAFYRQPCAT